MTSIHSFSYRFKSFLPKNLFKKPINHPTYRTINAFIRLLSAQTTHPKSILPTPQTNHPCSRPSAETSGRRRYVTRQQQRPPRRHQGFDCEQGWAVPSVSIGRWLPEGVGSRPGNTTAHSHWPQR